MGILNRNRYRIAERAQRLSDEAYRCPVPHQAAADACHAAGLRHRTINHDGAHPYVAVEADPDVDYVTFTAIEPAVYSTPHLTGWRVWYRHAGGVDMFRHGDPIKTGVWCATIAEAIEVVSRYQRSA
ncbi:hypothetical protein [Dactylosporangium sp. CA-139066]|uniref:hypothetical protein n=1 Tax=Dactylosporangium sp. CA-139066 TaxID=3239930 RepID=UPI003D8FD587